MPPAFFFPSQVFQDLWARREETGGPVQKCLLRGGPPGRPVRQCPQAGGAGGLCPWPVPKEQPAAVGRLLVERGMSPDMLLGAAALLPLVMPSLPTTTRCSSFSPSDTRVPGAFRLLPLPA